MPAPPWILHICQYNSNRIKKQKSFHDCLGYAQKGKGLKKEKMLAIYKLNGKSMTYRRNTFFLSRIECFGWGTSKLTHCKFSQMYSILLIFDQRLWDVHSREKIHYVDKLIKFRNLFSQLNLFLVSRREWITNWRIKK